MSEAAELASDDGHRIERRNRCSRKRQADNVHSLGRGPRGCNDRAGPHGRKVQPLEDFHIHGRGTGTGVNESGTGLRGRKGNGSGGEGSGESVWHADFNRRPRRSRSEGLGVPVAGSIQYL